MSAARSTDQISAWWRLGHHLFSPQLAPLFFYSLIMLLIYMGDGIMAYIAPIYIESVVRNPFVMGWVMAFSSIVGVICDTLFPAFFKSKHHLFFLWSTIVIALLFPVVYVFLPAHLVTLLIGMAVWGVYFEFLVFSNYHFIHAFTTHQQHPFAWGLITTFRSLGLVISPLAASALLDIHPTSPFYGAMLFFGFALASTLLFKVLFPTHQRQSTEPIVEKKFRIVQTMQIWTLLFKKIWPVYIFTFALFILESVFFTIGVLLSEDLHHLSIWGNLLIPAYIFPALFMGSWAHKAAQPFGKKKMAFGCGILAGVLLVVAGLMPSPLWLVACIFVSAIFSSLAMPEVLSATQDYVARLGKLHNEIIGLETTAGSVAYIVGPIVGGAIAALVGNQLTFSVVGGSLLIISLIAFFAVPRKIHLPQSELEALTASSGD